MPGYLSQFPHVHNDKNGADATGRWQGPRDIGTCSVQGNARGLAGAWFTPASACPGRACVPLGSGEHREAGGHSHLTALEC